MRLRRYSELVRLPTFEERFDYLKLNGSVASRTFGGDRWLNQDFYTSYDWKRARSSTIARDMGCDLGCEDFPIFDKVFVHHMNPMTVEDILHGNEAIVDPEFLITVSHRTHNAIHYGDESLLPQPFVDRRPGDTDLW